MLNSAQLEARTGIAFAASTLSKWGVPNPAFAKAASLFDPFPVVNDNSRSIAEQLRSTLVNAQRELSLVSMYLTPDFRRGTMRQLTHLLNPDSWDDEDTLPRPRSFRSFARAMAVIRPAIRPMLGLSSKGNLLAMWGSETSRVSFEHLSDDDVKWFVQSRREGDCDSAAGTTVIGRIQRILRAHEAEKLLFGEG